MEALAVVILVIALIHFCIKSEGFRRAVFRALKIGGVIGGAIVVVVGIGIGIYAWYEESRDADAASSTANATPLRKDEIADFRAALQEQFTATLIPKSDINVEEVRVEKRDGLFAGSYSLHGRVWNESDSLTVIRLNFSSNLLDCYETQCDTIGDERVTFDIKIPPGQARDIGESIHFPDVADLRNSRRGTHRRVTVNLVYAKHTEIK